MNYKQKLGYMTLGAVILAVGITIGQFVTPDIEAQSNGVFDTITCRELRFAGENGTSGVGVFINQKSAFLGDITCRYIRVVNDNYEDGITLWTADHASAITIRNSAHRGKLYLTVGKNEENGITLIDEVGRQAIQLLVLEDQNRVAVFDKKGIQAVNLSGGERFNSVDVNDSSGGTAISLFAANIGKGMSIVDKEGKEEFGITITPSRNQLRLRGKWPYKGGIGFIGDSNEAKQTRWSAPKED